MSVNLSERIRERRKALTLPTCNWCDTEAFYDFGGPVLCVLCARSLLAKCAIGDPDDIPAFLRRTH